MLAERFAVFNGFKCFVMVQRLFVICIVNLNLCSCFANAFCVQPLATKLLMKFY